MKIIWDITWKCNLNCAHCLAANNTNIKERELSTIEVIEIIDSLYEHSNLEQIRFLGGEPFLRSDFLEIYEYCQYKNISIGITTNGTCMNENTIESLVKLAKTHIVVAFSIDAPTSEANAKIRGDGTFEKCLASMTTLRRHIETQNKQHLFEVYINATLNKQSVNELQSYIDLAHGYGASTLTFANLILGGNLLKNHESLQLTIGDNENLFYGLEKFWRHYKATSSTVNVLFALPPKILAYYNQKYDISIPIMEKSCPVLADELRVDPFGNLTYCNMLEDNPYFSDIYRNTKINLLVSPINPASSILLKDKILELFNRSCNQNHSCQYSKYCNCCTPSEEDRCHLCREFGESKCLNSFYTI